MNQILDVLAICSLLAAFGIAMVSIQRAILFSILIKPLVDTAWDVKISGLSVIDFHAVLFLTISMYFLVKSGAVRRVSRLMVLLWFLAHFGLLFLLIVNPVQGFEGFIRALFFPVGLVLFWEFWRHDDSRSRLIHILLAASIFPAVVTVLQGLDLLAIESFRQTKGLTRANGYYHDIVTTRIYLVQGIISLYFCFRMRLLSFGPVLYAALLLLFVSAGFFLYSKAFIGSLVIGAMLFFVVERRFRSFLYFLIFVSLVGIAFHSKVIDTLEVVFVKEIGFHEGDVEADQLFSGRGMLLSHYYERFVSADFLSQLFGLHANEGRTHNEFMRVLILSGAFGFVAYVFLVVIIVFLALRSFIRRNPFSFVALWCASMMLIDATAVVWGLYPYYLIMMFGFLTISIKTTSVTYKQMLV